jgi:hypothetical protein
VSGPLRFGHQRSTWPAPSLRFPECLALLLEVASKVTLGRAGAVLDESVPPVGS